MKTILVDAVDTLILEGQGIDQAMHALLETYPNPKIILTNANDEQMDQFGLHDLPYPLFTLKQDPRKTDPTYFQTLFSTHSLRAEDVIYFEHGLEAVESARSVGILSFHFDHEKRDLEELKRFLDSHV